MQNESFQRKLVDHLSNLGNQLLGEDIDKSRSDSILSALDYFRLGVKYLIFDLEATRRENKFLRRLLDEIRDQQAE